MAKPLRSLTPYIKTLIITPLTKSFMAEIFGMLALIILSMSYLARLSLSDLINHTVHSINRTDGFILCIPKLCNGSVKLVTNIITTNLTIAYKFQYFTVILSNSAVSSRSVHIQ